VPLDGVVTAISPAIELFQILMCDYDVDIDAVVEERRTRYLPFGERENIVSRV
jgi:hypothetical protein